MLFTGVGAGVFTGVDGATNDSKRMGEGTGERFENRGEVS